MIDYLKINHLSIIIILYLAIGGVFGGDSVIDSTPIGVPSAVSTITNPWVFNQTVGITGALSVASAVTVGGLYTYSPAAVATTTGTGSSATLVESDLTDVGYHIVTLGGAVDTSFTYTLPATTTLTSFVSNVGERAEVCWFNTATSTSVGANLIFAAGTGIDLTVSTTTTPVPLGVGEKQLACIKFTRQSDGGGVAGDITAELILQGDAD